MQSNIDKTPSAIDAVWRRLDRVLADLRALEVSRGLHRVDAVLPSGRTESLLVQAASPVEAMYLAAKYAVSTHTQSTKRILYLGPAQGPVQSIGVRANWTETEARASARSATEIIRNYLAERPSRE